VVEHPVRLGLDVTEGIARIEALVKVVAVIRDLVTAAEAIPMVASFGFGNRA